MVQVAVDQQATAMQPIISVQNVGVQFNLKSRHRGVRELLIKGKVGRSTGQFWALRNVSFDVQPGEAIGVVGRNGQGKSTLLKVVAGVMLPDEGSVTLRANVSPLIEMTGGFVPDLTARENIYLAGGLHGMTRDTIDSKFEEIVSFAEAERFLDTPFRHFSSGMKVRLAFSVMAQLDEPILLVDEVLAVGDKAFRRKCYDRIDALLAEGRTLFMVSHSAGDLRRFCQRGLYLVKGHLKMDTSLDEVLDAYQRDSKEVGGPHRRRPPGKRPAPGGKQAPGKKPAPGNKQAPGKRPAPGNKQGAGSTPRPDGQAPHGDGWPPTGRPAADDA